MAAETDIFFLYKQGTEYYILRITKPSFSNSNEAEYDRVVEILEEKKQELVEKHHLQDATFIGEYQGLPEGDGFYGNDTRIHNVWYANHEKKGFIILGKATTENEFWQSVKGKYQKPAIFIKNVQLLTLP
ncbi:TPA: hypothetical protein HA278_02680 [Candidatus Woesearchaeota archaeon]|nr:hypothetical protein [archaeon]HIJ10939.1 hypothetical protein [Candidatus Woesearchaeota archaeon]|tara:strand:- start:52 stop:441 length:390 start_codon:yes stop_codon:yes gene_type:complete